MASATLEEVWKLFREVAEAQKETERRFQATDRQIAEMTAKTDRQIMEMTAKTDRQIMEMAAKTDRQIMEMTAKTDRQISEMSRKIGELGNRLGEFVESMVKPAVVRLFRERNIIIHQVHSDVAVHKGDEGMQIDLLVVNSTQAVLVEVKSKLTQLDVDEHLERLAKFKRLMPRYADVEAMGAVAAMVIPDELARYTYRKGLFVLAQSGEDLHILNDQRFQPRIW